MKPLFVFAVCFAFALTQAASADPPVPTKSAPQPIAHPRTNFHAPAVKPGANQPVGQRSANIRRNYQFARPVQSEAVAMMNVQSKARYYKARPEPAPLEQGKQVGLTTTTNLHRNNNRQSYFEALKRFRHERHDCNWWKRRCRTIVFVNTGYYYLDAGYWYPAYGYDPAYDYYDYDGPIYTYGDLLPDQVIANVQRALQEAGYYAGPITGSLNPATRAAISNFQRDYGLIITGAIDEPTVQSLELN